TGGDEAVPQNVPALENLPFALYFVPIRIVPIVQGSLEVVVCLLAAERGERLLLPLPHGGKASFEATRTHLLVLVPGGAAPLLAPFNDTSKAEQVGASWMHLHPLLENPGQKRGKWYAAMAPGAAFSFLLPEEHRLPGKVQVRYLGSHH